MHQSSGVVGTCCGLPTEGVLTDLFASDSGTIYVAEKYQRTVLAFHPSSETFTEVLQCPDGFHPAALLVQDRSLYVSMYEPTLSGRVCEYLLPPELQLH